MFIPIQRFNPSSLYFSDIDAVLAPEGVQHVLWTANISGAKYTLWHAHSSQDGVGCSAGSQVDSATITYSRAVVTGTLLHVFVSERRRRIRHLLKSPTDRTWREASLIGRPDDGLIAFDVIAAQAGLIVAYLAYDDADSTASFDDKPTKLVMAHIRNDDSVTYQELATLPHSEARSVGPKLVRWKSETHMICGATFLSVPGESATSTHLAFTTRVTHSYLRDGAMHWSQPASVKLDGGQMAGDLSGFAQGLATATNRDGLFVFLAHGGVLAVESADGRVWSAPLALSRYPVSEPSVGERTLAASADSSGICVAWVDQRFAARSSVLGQPMSSGGTDIVMLASKSSPVTLADLAASPAIRMTQPGCIVSSVVMRTDGSMQFLYWTEQRTTRIDGRYTLQAPRIGTVRFRSASRRTATSNGPKQE